MKEFLKNWAVFFVACGVGMALLFGLMELAIKLVDSFGGPISAIVIVAIVTFFVTLLLTFAEKLDEMTGD